METTAQIMQPIEREWVVEESMTAERHGNPGFSVLATPILVELIEITTLEQLAETLAPEEGSVGIELNLKHNAPTPAGDTVRVRAEAVERSGPIVTFAIEASDSVGGIAAGTHRRAVVDRHSFQAKVDGAR